MAHRTTSLLLMVQLILFSAGTWAALPLTLTASSDVATEGYLSFNWDKTTKGDSKLLLEIASDTDFSEAVQRYPLANQNKVSISGLGDGSYYARLVNDAGHPQSATVEFRVAHRSLLLAWTLFGIGALLFTALIATIAHLNAKNNDNRFGYGR